MALIEADDLFKFYHPGDAEVRALRGVSLTVEPGEVVALIGPSGSGKSTLLACLAGLDEPDGGIVTIDGCRMTRRPEAERAALRASSIGFLAQSGNLFDHLSVAENIKLQMNLSGKFDSCRVIELLSLLGLADRGHAMPATLSGGELARAGLAVALASDPPLLLADEPTAEVDAETESRILELLEARRAKGGAALIATHSSALGLKASRDTTVCSRRSIRVGIRIDVRASTTPTPSVIANHWTTAADCRSTERTVVESSAAKSVPLTPPAMATRPPSTTTSRAICPRLAPRKLNSACSRRRRAASARTIAMVNNMASTTPGSPRNSSRI